MSFCCNSVLHFGLSNAWHSLLCVQSCPQLRLCAAKWPSDNALGVWSVLLLPRKPVCNTVVTTVSTGLDSTMADGHLSEWTGEERAFSWLKHLKALRPRCSTCPSSCPFTKANWIDSFLFFFSLSPKALTWPFCDTFSPLSYLWHNLSMVLPCWRNWGQKEADQGALHIIGMVMHHRLPCRC